MQFRSSARWRPLAYAIGLRPAWGAFAQSVILNVSYDVSRELDKDIDPALIAHRAAKTDEAAPVGQSQGGSSEQALSVIGAVCDQNSVRH